MRRLPAFVSTAALLLATVVAGTFAATAPAVGVVLPTQTSMSSVAAGEGHTVVIGSDALPYGSGRNDQGQLTGASTADISTLTMLTGLPASVTAVAVSAAGDSTLVLGSNHVVYGTGNNADGQLTGTGDRSTLTALSGQPSAGVASIHASSYASLVIDANGIPYVTGLERSSQFGNIGNKTTLTPLPGMPAGVTALDAEIAFQNLYIVGSDHNVYAAGSNNFGQGPGTLGGPAVTVLTQMPVYDNAPILEISASPSNLVARGVDGNVYGAGQNFNGELGTGGQHNGLVNSPITGLPAGVNATAVAEGESFTLVLADDGRLYGCGSDDWGQLPGSHSSDRFLLQPLADAVPGDITAIAAGRFHTLLTDAEDIAYGSGYNTDDQITGVTTGTQGLRVLAGQKITSRTKPTISGTSQFTRLLTASPGNWSFHPSQYEYQWKQAGVDIAGATSSTYPLTSGDIGKKISVTVTAKRGRFADGTSTSVETATVTAAPAPVYASTKPKVKGTLKSGKTLSITRTSSQLLAGFNPDAAALAYRWYRNNAPISGAVKSTYKLTSKDKGKKIRVRVYGKKPFYATGSYLTATVTIKK